jgi:hypothetical protein
MIRLTVEIEVKNHKEIIAMNKGALAGNVASLFGGSKNIVEEEIKKQVKAAIERSLTRELTNKGVKAEVSVH